MTKRLKLDFLYSENQKGGGVFNFLKASEATTASSANPELSGDTVADSLSAPSVDTPVVSTDIVQVTEPLPLVGDSSSIDIVPPATDPLPLVGDSSSIDIVPPATDPLQPVVVDAPTAIEPLVTGNRPIFPLPSNTPPNALNNNVAAPETSILTNPNESLISPSEASTIPSSSSTMGYIPLPPPSEPSTMDFIQSDSSILEPEMADTSTDEPSPDIFLDPSVDNTIYSKNVTF